MINWGPEYFLVFSVAMVAKSMKWWSSYNYTGDTELPHFPLICLWVYKSEYKSSIIVGKKMLGLSWSDIHIEYRSDISQKINIGLYWYAI